MSGAVTRTFATPQSWSLAAGAYRGPALGKARVYVDGATATTLDLTARSDQWRRRVYVTDWASAGSHTIKVVCLATAGRPRIDLDVSVVVR